MKPALRLDHKYVITSPLKYGKFASSDMDAWLYITEINGLITHPSPSLRWSIRKRCPREPLHNPYVILIVCRDSTVGRRGGGEWNILRRFPGLRNSPNGYNLWSIYSIFHEINTRFCSFCSRFSCVYCCDSCSQLPGWRHWQWANIYIFSRQWSNAEMYGYIQPLSVGMYIYGTRYMHKRMLLPNRSTLDLGS